MFKVKVEMSENPNWILKQFQKQANIFTGKVSIGVFGGAHSITSKSGGKRSITMPDLAAIHEYGAPSRKIPERSFLRASITLNQGKYGKYLLGEVKDLLLLRTTPTKIKQVLGMQAAADVQMFMVNGKFAPLKAKTIKRKGSSKPLIDTGQLRQSITYRVVD
jgi:phage gpG-like protein